MRRRAALALMLAGLLGACGGGDGEAAAPHLPRLDEVAAADWAALANRQVFFGHQSVGNDILAGVADLLAASPHPQLRLEPVRAGTAGAAGRPALRHAMIGRNGAPLDKIRDFRRHLEQAPGPRPDIALFKFCYVDFDHATDVDALFAAYAQAMDELAQRYPATRFVHVTVPLESLPPTAWPRLKQAVKRLLGRPEVVADNARRMRFNTLLKQHYPATRIVDLALAEAVSADGTVASERLDGLRVQMLDRDYTTDGGHLNATGRRRVAEQFLVTLARVAGGS